MQNRVVRMLVSLLLGVLTLGSTVQAQYIERTIKANIPFDFVVGSEVFPAGHYSVVLIGPVRLELRDPEGHTLTNVLTQSVQAPSQAARPKLRFDSEGGQHVLTEVWQPGNDMGRQILRSRTATIAVRKRSGHLQTAEAGGPR